MSAKISSRRNIFFSLDFHYNVEIHFCVIIFDCSHLGKKYLLKAHTKNQNISFLKSCLKVPGAKISSAKLFRNPPSAKISFAKYSNSMLFEHEKKFC